MESLKEYISRTRGFMLDNLQGEGLFATHPDLGCKVDEDGCFRSFSGDTIVFDVSPEEKKAIARIQDILYKRCSDMLSERLAEDTFHVTLHDLNNGLPEKELAQAMEQSQGMAEAILYTVKEEKAEPIRVRTVSVFNMVSKSVVLGLEPADEYSCQRLMELHERFQAVVKLNYPLTLHITLAYYKPGEYSAEQRKMLRKTFSELTDTCGWEFQIEESALEYMQFDDMNQWRYVHGNYSIACLPTGMMRAAIDRLPQDTKDEFVVYLLNKNHDKILDKASEFIASQGVSMTVEDVKASLETEP